MKAKAKKRLFISKVYQRWCKTELCCKSSEKVGKDRRGRNKSKVTLFPYPKRGKHLVVDGVTIKAS